MVGTGVAVGGLVGTGVGGLGLGVGVHSGAWGPELHAGGEVGRGVDVGGLGVGVSRFSGHHGHAPVAPSSPSPSWESANTPTPNSKAIVRTPRTPSVYKTRTQWDFMAFPKRGIRGHGGTQRTGKAGMRTSTSMLPFIWAIGKRGAPPPLILLKLQCYISLSPFPGKTYANPLAHKTPKRREKVFPAF